MENLQFKNKDKMPIIGLGTWKSKPGETYNAIREAIKIGYRHIDCAAIYGNEKEIGQALKDSITTGEITREDIWITSKLWNNAHRKDHLPRALQKTLKDLCLDYLDLYLIHWPVAIKPEVTYPRRASDFIGLDELSLSETWEGMESCVKKGWTKHIGVSNFSMKKLDGLMKTASIKPEMNQIELHPFLQQNDMLGYCKENNLLLTAYAPLGSGDRPRGMKGKDEQSLLDNQVIQKIAKKNDCSPAQILIRWAIKRGTAVIPKSVNPGRLAENFKSLAIKLSNEDMTALSRLESGSRYIRGDFWTMPGSPYTMNNLWE